MTFYRGQVVICVNNRRWRDCQTGRFKRGPRYRSEWTVTKVIPNYFEGDDYLTLIENGPHPIAAKAFRPKEPDIEALRALLANLPKKRTKAVAVRRKAPARVEKV